MTNYTWADTCETMEDNYYTFKNMIINNISNLLDEDMDYLTENRQTRTVLRGRILYEVLRKICVTCYMLYIFLF